jgi:hypothetical protein
MCDLGIHTSDLEQESRSKKSRRPGGQPGHSGRAAVRARPGANATVDLVAIAVAIVSELRASSPLPLPELQLYTALYAARHTFDGCAVGGELPGKVPRLGVGELPVHPAVFHRETSERLVDLSECPTPNPPAVPIWCRGAKDSWGGTNWLATAAKVERSLTPPQGMLPAGWLPSRHFARLWLSFVTKSEHPVTSLP